MRKFMPLIALLAFALPAQAQLSFGTVRRIVVSTPDKPAVYSADAANDEQVAVRETVVAVVENTAQSSIKIEGVRHYLTFSESAFSDKKLGDKLPNDLLKPGSKIMVTGYRYKRVGLPTFFVEALQSATDADDGLEYVSLPGILGDLIEHVASEAEGLIRGRAAGRGLRFGSGRGVHHAPIVRGPRILAAPSYGYGHAGAAFAPASCYAPPVLSAPRFYAPAPFMAPASCDCEAPPVLEAPRVYVPPPVFIPRAPAYAPSCGCHGGGAAFAPSFAPSFAPAYGYGGASFGASFAAGHSVGFGRSFGGGFFPGRSLGFFPGRAFAPAFVGGGGLNINIGNRFR